jgi:hypothetical protein
MPTRCCRLYVRRGLGTVGSQYLAACGGKGYWELRVVTATGFAAVGFAGTSFFCGQQAPSEAFLGIDEASWAVGNGEGNGQCYPIHNPGCVVFIPLLCEPRA